MFIDRKVWTRGISRQKVVQAKGWSYTWIGRMGRRSDKWTSTVIGSALQLNRDAVFFSFVCSIVEKFQFSPFVTGHCHSLWAGDVVFGTVYTSSSFLYSALWLKGSSKLSTRSHSLGKTLYKFCFVFLKPFSCFSNELQQEQSSGLCCSTVWLGRMQLSGQWVNCWPVYMPTKETLRRSGLLTQVKKFSSFIVSQLGLCIDWVSQVGSIFSWMHHAEHMDVPSSIGIWQRVRLCPFPSFS
jgi:hypothetical protein